MPPTQPHQVSPAIAARAARQPSPRTIVACVALACLLIVGLDAWRTWTARATIVESEKIDTANLARSLAQHAHDMLATADTLLVSLRETVESNPDSPERRAHLRHLLASQIATVPIMRDLMVFDAEGMRTVNSGRPAPAVENISDREYFQYHAAHIDRGAHLADPVPGKLDGTWIIALTRRVDRPDGSFGGMVAATFSVAAIRRFYETFDVGRDGFIGLNTAGGVLVARYPGDDGQIGRKIASTAAYADMLAAAPAANWQSVSPVDGVEHLGSRRAVDAFPLVVVVGKGLHELLGPWRAEGLFHLAISICTSAALALLGLRFARQLSLHHQAEQDLLRSERQYRLLADNNTDLVVQLDAGLRHTYASPASERLLGYAPHEMVGALPSDLCHEDDRPSLASTLATIVRTGAAPPLTYRTRRRDGSEVWIEAVGRHLADNGGIILVKRDVTQRRTAELQLRQAQRMEAVGQLTAGVAHDFNNLLQAQLGALELLLENVGNDGKTVQFASIALGSAEHAAKLTHSLLSFSRQQVLDPAPVPVPALLDRLKTILSRTLGPRIELHLDVEADLPPLFADPAQTEAALLNLALNARDAMPDGGRLWIGACDPVATLNAPDMLEPGRHLVLTVADEGSGMSPETLAQACEPFFTTKGVGKGSGLGLSMVQGFARQSGGALRFFSTAGQGTRIELWLPAAPMVEPKPPVPPAGQVRGAGRILLVDDLREVLMILTEALEFAGFDVVPVTSGEAALSMLAGDLRFAALVTDFAMPGIDGGELARRARQLRPDLPTMIITGYVDSEKLNHLPAGVAVLRKPLGTTELTSRILDLLAVQPHAMQPAAYAAS